MNQIGIITALIPEAACLTSLPITTGEIMRLENNICLYVCGMGAERAGAAAMEMIRAGMDILVSWGTAGAIAPDPDPGDLLVPESIVAFDGRVYQTAKHWRSAVLNKLVDCSCNIYLGQLADSMHVLTTAEDKTDTASNFKTAIAVDMESAAIAEVASNHEKPCIVIRVISDSKGMIIPEIALKISDQYGRVKFRSLLVQLLAHPLQVPKLIALARGYGKAASTMKWVGQKLKIMFP